MKPIMLKPKRNVKPERKVNRNWLDLPRDVTKSILFRLGPIEIIKNTQKVCTQWRSICKDPSMWRSIDMGSIGPINVCDLPYMVKICMQAVDRSNGGFKEIKIGSFGSDALLSYIGQSSSNLRRLQLVNYWSISDKGLCEAAKKFSLLEELEIYSLSTGYSINIGQNAVEAVGRCCPLLKTLKFNQVGIRKSSFINDGEARAIAENMHGLRHLQLIGNKLTNQGLEAILNGCPYLESLDLRKCFHIDLEGDMGKRCAEQIKNLRCPNDSTDDYEFTAEVDDYDYSYDYECDCFSDCEGHDSGSNYDDWVIIREYNGLD